MNFTDFLSGLSQIESEALPGPHAHYKMAPVNRKALDLNLIDKTKVKRAAVAALFFNAEDYPHIVLTQRKTYPGVHSGQISFPGGKREKSDLDFRDTALRETEEEIGIERSEITLHKNLSELYIPPSNFLVQPYLGTINNFPNFKAEEKEVDKIISIDFNKFLDDGNIELRTIKIGSGSIQVPAFTMEGHIIWGATAMMISELREMFLKLG